MVYPTEEPQDTQDLVQRAQQGDQMALAVLYETYFERIYRYSLARLGNMAEAEDITEEVFLRMLRSIASFQWKAHGFEAWLFRIAHNLVIDHLRRQISHKTYRSLITGSFVDDSLEDDLNGKWNQEELGQAIEQLTPAQRDVVTLRFAGGLSLAETAAILDKQVGNVKVLQHNALISLRKVLTSMQSHPEGKPWTRKRTSLNSALTGS